jgi:hypothetical protein
MQISDRHPGPLKLSWFARIAVCMCPKVNRSSLMDSITVATSIANLAHPDIP